MVVRTGTLAVLLFGLCGALQGAQTPTADELVARAGAYVADFVTRFSTLVAEEHYSQQLELEREAGGLPFRDQQTRELRSDFLLVALPGTHDLVSFRDVFEVDGRPVRDRDDRLARLFLDPRSLPPPERVQEIRDESARHRFNIGIALEDPLLALSFVQADYRGRFAWTVLGVDPGVGSDVWRVGFTETASPTIAQGGPDGDLPLAGAVWIEARTGGVLKTEVHLELPSPLGERRITRSEAVATFGFDEDLALVVPTELRENYFVFGGGVTGGEITSVATYGRFRRFGVTTGIVIDEPEVER